MGGVVCSIGCGGHSKYMCRYVCVFVHVYVCDRYRFGLGWSMNVFWSGDSMFGMFAFNVLYGMCVYVSFKFGRE